MTIVRSRHSTPVPALAAVLVLAACGGGPAADETRAPEPAPSASASTAPTPITPCSYITKAEAEAALGIPLQDPREGAYNPVSRDAACEFDSAGELKTLALSVRVTSVVDQAASIARLEDLMGEDRETVDGIGDRAFVAMSQLFVFKDDHQLTVIVTPIVRPAEKRVAARQAIAGMVIDRLPR